MLPAGSTLHQRLPFPYLLLRPVTPKTKPVIPVETITLLLSLSLSILSSFIFVGKHSTAPGNVVFFSPTACRNDIESRQPRLQSILPVFFLLNRSLPSILLSLSPLPFSFSLFLSFLLSLLSFLFKTFIPPPALFYFFFFPLVLPHFIDMTEVRLDFCGQRSQKRKRGKSEGEKKERDFCSTASRAAMEGLINDTVPWWLLFASRWIAGEPGSSGFFFRCDLEPLRTIENYP